ncbi:ring finger protein 11 (sid 1669) (nedd4 ww domain-binding protein 2), putative [Schistosoma mansoni]|uniref:ring finger protein 11 (sid 1669) (nedd4 ww domain-binding protein 2), putative n=1 Tax=Schistosoma mansoni TaxID=6183 RepID=UPI00022C822A|nr:ring finger protein 11 (sid 1669) (nedd4 ww domain-binding protein 2), putative [Schistosoma mansoni]|eukprot:XP_018647398.1 ring finger protein 11 (sid 1669) (nedd4 ww domain-binding protein 2), putative [Schistosoma mansoni]
MDNNSSMMQQRRSSIKLYTEFSQNYPAVYNLPIQIDNSSHSTRSIIIPSMITQSTGIQTMDTAPEVSVQVDLLTQQSEFTQTDLEYDINNNNNNSSTTTIDATIESSGHLDNSNDSLSTLRVYLLNQLPISVLLDDTSIKKLHNCSICMENYHIGDRIMGLPCFHMFHYNCLYVWIEKNLQCPMCRMPIYEID